MRRLGLTLIAFLLGISIRPSVHAQQDAFQTGPNTPDYWKKKIQDCNSQIRSLRTNGASFPENNCVRSLEAEFMQSGNAESKIACLAEAGVRQFAADAYPKPDLLSVMWTGHKLNPICLRKGSLNDRLKVLAHCQELIAQNNCDRAWKFSGLFNYWDQLRRDEKDVREELTATREENKFNDRYAQLQAAQSARLLKWRESSLRPGVKVAYARENIWVAEITGLKGNAVEIKHAVCVVADSITERTHYKVTDAMGNTTYRTEDKEGAPVCAHWGTERKLVDRTSLTPSGWNSNIRCNGKIEDCLTDFERNASLLSR